jgi:hypothetical protein
MGAPDVLALDAALFVYRARDKMRLLRFENLW